MVKVLKANARDLNTILDLDLKTHAYPWAGTNWANVFNNPQSVIYVASIALKQVGFCVLHQPEQGQELQILRMGVHEQFRGLGVGRRLLMEGYKLAHDLLCKKMTIIVPDIHCMPGDPDDVSVILNKQGFFAGPPIYADHFLMYGGKVDGYKFTKELP